MRLCLARWSERLNLAPQVSHTCARSSACTRRCLAKLVDSANAASQPSTGHAKGLSPVCERTWHVNADECVNALPQVAQTYGRSRVCVRRCCVSVVTSAKRLPHVSHACGLSPVHSASFAFRISQAVLFRAVWGGSAPVWTMRCLISFCRCTNVLSLPPLASLQPCQRQV